MAGRLPKAALIDIDGTLVFNGQAIPGAAEALGWLNRQGVDVRLLTNIDSRTPGTISMQLAQVGLRVEPADIFTPAVAALELVRRTEHSRCFGLISHDLARLFEDFLIADGHADFVIVGDCREIEGYADLNAAFRQLMGGAELLALSEGRWFHMLDGDIGLDTGAFVQLLEYASGKVARLLGKPSRDFFELALASVGCPADETIVVGDDVNTDIAGATEVGAFSVLVRTGKGATVEAGAADLVLDSIAQLPERLAAAYTK